MMLDMTRSKEQVTISAPNFQRAEISIRGTSPYIQNKMSARNMASMRATQEAGQQAKSKKKREAKKFDTLHLEALHVPVKGGYGIPCTAFRQAMIDACRLVGYQMTKAKMSVFVLPDDFDKDDGQPLVKLIAKTPRALEMTVRLANGSTDIAVRPQFMEWSAKLNLEWDGDQFSATDVANLVLRAGRQVGVGAGRPFSKMSVGLGFGTWEVSN